MTTKSARLSGGTNNFLKCPECECHTVKSPWPDTSITEIECLNGAVIREGKKLGIATHTNEVLYSLVRIIESTYDNRVKY